MHRSHHPSYQYTTISDIMETSNATPSPANDESTPTNPSLTEPRNAVKSDPTTKKEKKKTGDAKTLWVTVFRCFHCGKHGRRLPKCNHCAQAYYCDSGCQRKHWK